MIDNVMHIYTLALNIHKLGFFFILFLQANRKSQTSVPFQDNDMGIFFFRKINPHVFRNELFNLL